MKIRPQLDIPGELDQPDRQAVDRAVLETCGVDSARLPDLYAAVRELVSNRLTRAASTR